MHMNTGWAPNSNNSQMFPCAYIVYPTFVRTSPGLFSRIS